jgi:hypothetical protein
MKLRVFCPFDQVRAIRLDLSCIFSYLGTSLEARLYSENKLGLSCAKLRLSLARQLARLDKLGYIS